MGFAVKCRARADDDPYQKDFPWVGSCKYRSPREPSRRAFFVGASGMTRSVIPDAVNRGAKANREVTDRVRVPVETLMTGTPSRNARASAVRRSPKEAAGKLLARRT